MYRLTLMTMACSIWLFGQTSEAFTFEGPPKVAVSHYMQGYRMPDHGIVSEMVEDLDLVTVILMLSLQAQQPTPPSSPCLWAQALGNLRSRPHSIGSPTMPCPPQTRSGFALRSMSFSTLDGIVRRHSLNDYPVASVIAPEAFTKLPGSVPSAAQRYRCRWSQGSTHCRLGSISQSLVFVKCAAVTNNDQTYGPYFTFP